MRVISGSAKGRRLIAPKGYSTRPTSDKVKGAIFNSIATYVGNSKFLDLFAGTGSIGIEALSRGADNCTFIDQSSQAIRYIKSNLSNLNFEDKSLVIKGDATKIIDKLDTKYNIIFMDPPYRLDLVIPILKRLGRLLKETGIVIIETEQKLNLPVECDKFYLKKLSKYGDTQIAYYELKC